MDNTTEMEKTMAEKAKEQLGDGVERFFPRMILGSSLGGVSLREWFAGLAMAGLMDPDPQISLSAAEVASRSVAQADALIAALKVPTSEKR